MLKFVRVCSLVGRYYYYVFSSKTFEIVSFSEQLNHLWSVLVGCNRRFVDDITNSVVFIAIKQKHSSNQIL